MSSATFYTWRAIRLFNVIDYFNREGLAIDVDFPCQQSDYDGGGMSLLLKALKNGMITARLLT